MPDQPRAGRDAATLVVPIDGMTCAACEAKVTRALLKVPGVESVEVSAPRGRATVSGEDLPDRLDVEAAILAAGYTPQSPPWLTRDSAVWRTAVAAAVLVVAAVAVASALGLFDVSVSPSGRNGVGVALLVGLAAGFSTCMALVGGLVMALTASYGARQPDRVATWRGRLRPQLAFNGGRIAGFAVGGALLGLLGSAFDLPTRLLAVVVLAAALVMAVIGVRLTGLSPRIAAWSPTLPGSWAGWAGSEGGGYSDLRALGAGAATFVLPCGITQAMQIYAVSTGSPGQAAAVMAAFALGTTPGLLGLGVAAGAASARRGTTAVQVVGVVVLAFALVNATGALRSLGLTAPGFGSQAAPTELSANVILDGGTQTVTMTQVADGYEPADTVVAAGVPITWVIESTAPYTCAAMLRVPDLGVSVDLPPGTTTVPLPALDEGTTPFTCVMGMYSGNLIAIPAPADATTPSPGSVT